MKFSIISLFPEQVRDALSFSMTARAMERGLIELDLVQIRDFAINDYGQVDDAPYGGGRGMVMMCEPIYNAWRSVVEQYDEVEDDMSSDCVTATFSQMFRRILYTRSFFHRQEDV